MIIDNRTRYCTEDLEAIIKAGAAGIYSEGWLSRMTFDVTYASDTMAMPAGCFVKFNRNGDESSTNKKITLLRPNKIRGLSPIIELEMLSSKKLNPSLVRELIVRLHAIKEYDRSAYRTRKNIHRCTDEFRRYKHYIDSAEALLAANPDIQLRFRDKELTVEEMALLESYNQAVVAEATVRERLSGAKHSRDYYQERLTRLISETGDTTERIQSENANIVTFTSKLEEARLTLEQLKQQLPKNI